MGALAGGATATAAARSGLASNPKSIQSQRQRARRRSVGRFALIRSRPESESKREGVSDVRKKIPARAHC